MTLLLILLVATGIAWASAVGVQLVGSHPAGILAATGTNKRALKDVGFPLFNFNPIVRREFHGAQSSPLAELLRGLRVLLATVITNSGLAVFTNRIIQAGTAPKNIGWGTGAGTAAAGDTTLFTEALVNMTGGGTDHTVGTEARLTTTQTNDTWQVTGTRTATGAGTVTNAGLFDAASGGTLTVKGDFTGIGLASGDSISFDFRVKLA